MPGVSGLVYGADGFREGTVRFREGIVEEIRPVVEEDVIARGIILPCFFNAHTHVGDSIILEEPVGTLEEIVAPPSGLKFRRLGQVSQEELVDAMRRTLRRMVLSGSAGFSDFREGGVEGAKALRGALRESPLKGVLLGRPASLSYDKGEVDALLQMVDGVGVSSVSDWDYSELERLARHTRAKGKTFSLHASEASREDVDVVLDLKPDFLIHMTMASSSDWERCAQEGVPVVVCPRSQLFFGRLPDIPGMLEAGLTLYLGTDNAMFASPSMLREMEFAYHVSKLRTSLPPERVIRMAIGGAKLLNSPHPITIQEGVPSSLLVLDVPTRGDAYYQAIRATEADILLLSLGERMWVRDRGWIEGA